MLPADAAFLSFTIGDHRFALPATGVISVVPFAPLRQIDGTPAWVAGVLPYFDRLVPVIDLCRLQAARASRRAYATRIIVVPYPAKSGEMQPLGLLAEQVTDVLELAPAAWHAPGLATPETPWLGPLANVGGTWVQQVASAELLPADVRDRLFP